MSHSTLEMTFITAELELMKNPHRSSPFAYLTCLMECEEVLRIAHAGDAIVITTIGGPQGKGADGDVLAYRSLEGGNSWLGPVKVNDIEASARDVVWITKRQGQLRLVKLGTRNSTIIAENARDPVVAVGDGNESPVFVFWEQRAGDRVSIECQLVQ